MPKLFRREFIMVALASTLLLLWSSIPNWAGYAAQDAQHAFSGTYFDAGDYAVHIAMMRYGMQGAWSYTLRFTSEPHSSAYIRMFYIALGELNRMLQMSPELLYQVARWILGYAALFSIYLLMKRGLRASRWVWLAFFLAVLGSGLGWLQQIFGWVPSRITPIDFWLIDCYVLFSLSLFPHFALTLALMCLAYVWFLDYLECGGWWRVASVIAAALIVQLVNPVAFVVVDVAIAVAALIQRLTHGRQHIASLWGAVFAIGLAQIPLLIYNFEVLTNAPVWSQFTAQNLTLSPPPVYHLWGFGLYWPLALVGSIEAFRHRDVVLLSSLAWVVSAFALAYAPFAIQRRFLLGITIPLSLLAAQGFAVSIRFVASRSGWLSRRAPALALLTVLLTSITSLTFFPAQAFFMRTLPPDYFYPRALDSAFAWIVANTGLNDLILSAPHTGQLIAQKTGRPVYIGHEMETLYYDAKERDVASFYQGDSLSTSAMFRPVRWVIYGPYEYNVAPDFNAGPDLWLAWQSGNIRIYDIVVTP